MSTEVINQEVGSFSHTLTQLDLDCFETSGVAPYLPLERLQVQGTSTHSPPFRLETAEQH